MVFSNKIKVIIQFRQSVKNIKNIDFFSSVIQKVLDSNVRTMVIVYEKNPKLLYDMLDEYLLYTTKKIFKNFHRNQIF